MVSYLLCFRTAEKAEVVSELRGGSSSLANRRLAAVLVMEYVCNGGADPGPPTGSGISP
jgi:hypothetical protein